MKRKRRRNHRKPTASTLPETRFPRNPVLTQPAGFSPTGPDRQAAAKGRMVFFSGRVIAIVEAIIAYMRHWEAIWYYLTPSGDPVATATDVIIPRQEVTSASCTVDPREVLRCARLAERRGGRIGFPGHGHGSNFLGTSGQDWRQLESQCCEGLGLTTKVCKTTAGEVRPVADETHGGALYEVGFGANVKETVRIATGSAVEGMAVELCESQRSILTYFTTSNQSQGHLVAGLEAVRCSKCGASVYRRIPPEEITVCVVGPIEITDEQREAIHAELAEKVTSGYWEFNRPQQAIDDHASWQPAVAGPVVAQDGQDYELWRGNTRIATITPACLEESAAKCESLSQQLGWSTSQAQGQAQEPRANHEEGGSQTDEHTG